MGRPCRTCEVLKEIYWLRVNQFLGAMRSASAEPPRALREEELIAMKDEALQALRNLIQHAKSCYQQARDEAA